MVNIELLHTPVGSQHQGSTHSFYTFLWAVSGQHRAFTYSCGQSTPEVNTELLHIPVGSQHQRSTQSFYTFPWAVNTRGQHTAFTHSCGQSTHIFYTFLWAVNTRGQQSFYIFLWAVRGQHRAFTHSCGQSTPGVNTEPLHITEGSQGSTQFFLHIPVGSQHQGQHRAFIYSCGQSTPVGSQHSWTISRSTVFFKDVGVSESHWLTKLEILLH